MNCKVDLQCSQVMSGLRFTAGCSRSYGWGRSGHSRSVTIIMFAELFRTEFLSLPFGTLVFGLPKYTASSRLGSWQANLSPPASKNQPGRM
jgi:hypothetical protein